MLKSKNRIFLAAQLLLLLSGLVLAFNGDFILSSAVLGFTVLFSQTNVQRDSNRY